MSPGTAGPAPEGAVPWELGPLPPEHAETASLLLGLFVVALPPEFAWMEHRDLLQRLVHGAAPVLDRAVAAMLAAARGGADDRAAWAELAREIEEADLVRLRALIPPRDELRAGRAMDGETAFARLRAHREAAALEASQAGPDAALLRQVARDHTRRALEATSPESRERLARIAAGLEDLADRVDLRARPAAQGEPDAARDEEEGR